MPKKNKIAARRRRIRGRIRSKIHGTQERPRMCVFRSNRDIYVQLIDDDAGHTLVSASTREGDVDGGNPVEKSRAVGQRVAERARAAGIEQVVFDRNVYRYHGRVEALAEGARKGGLQF